MNNNEVNNRNQEKGNNNQIIYFFSSLWVKIIRLINNPVIKTIIILLIIFFALFYFFAKYDEIAEGIKGININYHLLFFSFSLVLINTFMGVTIWWFLLSWLGHQKRWISVVKGYSISTLAKYIPGSIWQYAGRAYYMNGLAISKKVVGIAIFSEYILITFLGIIFACILNIFIDRLLISISPLINVIINFVAFLLITLILIYPKLVGRFIKKKKNSYYYYFLAIFLYLLGWALMGTAYWSIVKSLGIDNMSMPTALFFHSVSFASGNIVLFIPNGLVIRETLLIVMGRGLYNETLLILSSLLLRVIILLSELVVTAILISISLLSRKKN